MIPTTIRCAIFLFLFTGCAALMMTQLPSASPPLNCSVTRRPDGLFGYHLSRPPCSSTCETQWETENRTVIALDDKFTEHLVQNLTNKSIILKHCLDFLYHRVDCPPVGIDWEETNCIVNCSLLLHQKPHPFTGNNFFSWLTAGVIFGLGAIIAMVLIIVFIKCRRTGSKNVTSNPQYLRTETTDGGYV